MNVHVRIQPSSGVPIYRQIAAEVKAAFLRGQLPSGARLPSVRELAAELGTNPNTVVKAYDLLEQERVILRQQGRGAFVAGGREPLLASEKKELVRRLASELALEGRRLGMSEAEIVAALRAELERLRPEDEGPGA